MNARDREEKSLFAFSILSDLLHGHIMHSALYGEKIYGRIMIKCIFPSAILFPSFSRSAVRTKKKGDIWQSGKSNYCCCVATRCAIILVGKEGAPPLHKLFTECFCGVSFSMENAQIASFHPSVFSGQSSDHPYG
jgi:hypothetical protein